MKEYTGTALLTQQLSKPYELDPYLPSDSLKEAVNLAMVLERPLLVKGEPGCGKSRLAEAVAAELHGTDFRNKYFRWNIRSAEKAQNGRYVIDNLQRLQDATFNKKDNVKVELFKDAKTGKYTGKGSYIELGVLGKAFLLSHDIPEGDPPPVILIDEIDKADLDFPNDLLLELDKMEFDIPEIIVGNKPLTIAADEKVKPFFIITSNDEKPLPPAFLRRCMFHYIDFTEIKLFDIAESNYPTLGANLINQSIKYFTQWRGMIEKKAVSNKNISTSELLDWMKLIAHYKQKTDPTSAGFIENDLPRYYQSLLKDVESIKLFRKKDTPAPAVP